MLDSHQLFAPLLLTFILLLNFFILFTCRGLRPAFSFITILFSLSFPVACAR
ncbi:hypothetical protein BDW59DRAFT_141851, partial [Aspergillus cavernicola]